MEKDQHVQNQVMYVTNQAYDELQPSSDSTDQNEELTGSIDQSDEVNNSIHH